jgi:hypothetical protein
MEIDVTNEVVRVFRKDDKIVAIELQNGIIERYKTEEMNNGDSNELFDIVSIRN